MTRFAFNTKIFVLYITGNDLDITVFVLNIPGLVLNITGFVLKSLSLS